MNIYFIFTDLKGYSTLTEEEMKQFQSQTCVELEQCLREFLSSKQLLTLNTWGDAIYAVFEEADMAVRFALAYRDFFQNRKLNDKPLMPRIAAHFGSANKIEDPLNNKKLNFYGSHVNTTARMEPITRPGEIFVSKAFRDNYCADAKKKTFDIEFEELGALELAKDYGDMNVYRLRRKSDKKQIVDKLILEDLSDFIPTIPRPSDEEQKRLENLKNLTSPRIFDTQIQMTGQQTFGAVALLELADKAKSLGLYKLCLSLLEQANTVKMEVNGEQVYAVHHLPSYRKTKANALTRLGQYKEAEDIMFGLWHSGQKDADTLCMLAAQYKRRGVFGKSKTEDLAQVQINNLDTSLLQRACKLYIEAFRKDISNYYPAINAAYLYLMVGGTERGRGRKLAGYILGSWEIPKQPDWYLAATLAEAEMLCGESDEALDMFKLAVRDHTPTVFQLDSTLEQIKLYAKVTSAEQEVSKILAYLQQQSQAMAD